MIFTLSALRGIAQLSRKARGPTMERFIRLRGDCGRMLLIMNVLTGHCFKLLGTEMMPLSW